MNIQFFIAGILSLLAAFVHSFTGEYWIFTHLQQSTLPHTPFGDANVTKRILRVVWHFVTVDFLVSAIGLIVLAASGFTGSPKVTARMISLHYAGYVVVGHVDIILRVADLSKLREILGSRGFEIQSGGTESNFVLADNSGLEVDVHAVVFDRDGNGVYRMENGSDWIFPAEGFSGRGVVQGIGVRCLSAETQVLCHAQGYVPKEKDLRDMELLRARFGVELPPHLRRNNV